MSELVKALIKARQSFQPIIKDKTNPHFKTKYASLDAVLAAVQPGLDAAGLAIVQTIEMMDGHSVLITELLHESGESKRSVYPLQNQSDPQKFGGAISYGRRYSVCAILSVVADEDDDGNTASDRGKAESKPQSKQNGSQSDAKRTALLAKTTAQFKALGWYSDPEKCSEFIECCIPGKKSRGDLTTEQIEKLSNELHSLIQAQAIYEPDIEKRALTKSS